MPRCQKTEAPIVDNQSGDVDVLYLFILIAALKENMTVWYMKERHQSVSGKKCDSMTLLIALSNCMPHSIGERGRQQHHSSNGVLAGDAIKNETLFIVYIVRK